MNQTYRYKHHIKAVKLEPTLKSLKELVEFLHGSKENSFNPDEDVLTRIIANKGLRLTVGDNVLYILFGDYAIRDSDYEIHVCKGDVFENTYEPIKEES